MDFTVLSRPKAEQFTINQRYAVISISGVSQPPANIPNHPDRVGILRLHFEDEEDEERGGMTELQAAQVAHFVTNLVSLWGKDIFIMVHCHGGISRSSGCAAAISKFFERDDFWVFNNPKYSPCILVYRRVLDKLQLLHNKAYFDDPE